jgi:hypothetical protein
MMFQDLLRLNVQAARGSGFEHFLGYRNDEASGHDRWFLEDLRTLAVECPALNEVFGSEYQPLRDACYALVVETHRCETGPDHVALLLALEATGWVFFEQLSAAANRLCPELPLRYFARSHLIAERDYDLFAESTDATLSRIALTEEERSRAERMVERVYRTFDDVFSYLAVHAQEGMRTTSDVRALQFPSESHRPMRHAEGS